MNGLITNGLLAGPSGMILGQFKLSIFNIVIEKKASAGSQLERAERVVEEEIHQLRFVITLDGQQKSKTFKLSKRTAVMTVRLIDSFKKIKKEIQVIFKKFFSS